MHSCGWQRTCAHVGVLEQQTGKGIAAGALIDKAKQVGVSVFNNKILCNAKTDKLIFRASEKK